MVELSRYFATAPADDRHFWRRPRAGVSFDRRRLIDTEPGVVLVWSQRPKGGAGQIVMVHGLEGSGEAKYRKPEHGGAAGGFAAHRFHMRICGGIGAHETLYRGLTSDLLAVLRKLRSDVGPAIPVGFSLGGNVALKLAENCANRRTSISRRLRSFGRADLACARRIAGVTNRLYERRFVQRMQARLCATGGTGRRSRGLSSVIGWTTGSRRLRSGSATRITTTGRTGGRAFNGLRVPALLIAKDTYVRAARRVRIGGVRGNHIAGSAGAWRSRDFTRGPHRFWWIE